MIHYITVHFGGDQWVDTQLKHIEKFTSDYKVWCFFDEHMDTSPHKHKYHFLENHCNTSVAKKDGGMSGSYDHATKLDNLFKVVAEDEGTKDDDVVIFLDSDAFPIDNVNEYVKSKLQSYIFCAVHRPEIIKCPIPHPCFAFCTMDFWINNNFSWMPPDFTRAVKSCTYDTGGKVLSDLQRNNIEWLRIKRTNRSSIYYHPVFFSSYDNIVYHHGASSRPNNLNRATTIFMKKNPNLFKDINENIQEIALEAIKNNYFINQKWKKRNEN
jgi:hypothetical protein|tara:strand:- start:13576 stop:14382 length:807 start_codon:yes stop_codon:yes gene_type:complete